MIVYGQRVYERGICSAAMPGAHVRVQRRAKDDDGIRHVRWSASFARCCSASLSGYARRSLRPRPSAMNVKTKALSDTPSAFARVANRAWTVFGTRATNFPDATPPLFGAGIGNSFALRAAIVDFNASFPFVSASSMDSPSDRQSEKSGYEMRKPPPSSGESGRISNG